MSTIGGKRGGRVGWISSSTSNARKIYSMSSYKENCRPRLVKACSYQNLKKPNSKAQVKKNAPLKRCTILRPLVYPLRPLEKSCTVSPQPRHLHESHSLDYKLSLW